MHYNSVERRRAAEIARTAASGRAVRGKVALHRCHCESPLASKKQLLKMVASALFIMDLKGKIIISRNFRGDVPMTVSETFR